MPAATPPAGTPGSTSGGATGGQMWTTGTYDPVLDLVFVGTGNPTPVLNGAARPGDNQQRAFTMLDGFQLFGVQLER